MSTDPTFSSLSIDRDDNDQTNDVLGNDSNTIDATPLRTKILQVVKSSPDFTLRPARLSQELGISVTDASAELCGLLKAVGEGSSFKFEKVGNVHTMVFTFPPNFESKALRAQQAEDWKQTLQGGLEVSIKLLKLLTAFGLILSTVIVAVAGMVALLAAFVAISRGGDRRQQHHISRQLQNLFVMIRQLLWCYAMMGPDSDNDGDPFFREAAYDTSLMLSICCGNPTSMWFWWRASQLRRRRRRIARGWGRINSSMYQDDDGGEGDLEGIRLVRRGQWGQEEILPVPGSSSDDHRGLLSVAVEFLFGPNKSTNGPSDADRWRLRNAVILEKSDQSKSSSIALQELCPYLDNPPSTLNQTSKVVAEGLLVVAHFNGVPATKAGEGDRSPTVETDLSKAQFVFPELLAESSGPSMSRYDDPSTIYQATTLGVDPQRQWKGFFYERDASSSTLSSPTTTRTGGTTTNLPTPVYLYEGTKVFTTLTSRQFYHVLLVGILNAVGVLWFAQSLEVGGVLEQVLAPGVTQGLQWALIPVLIFYAKLFFAIAFVRLSYVALWNEACLRRNRTRSFLASELSAHASSQVESVESPVAQVIQL